MAIDYTPQYSLLATVTNAGTFPVQIGAGNIVSISNGAIISVSGVSIEAVTVSNLSTVPLTVSGTTIAITSLPDLGLNSSVKITSLPSLAFGQSVTITNGAILSVTNLVSVIPTPPAYRFTVSTAPPIAGYWSVTSTYTSAQTSVILIPLSASTTAHHITDIIFSNNSTHGNMSLVESRANAAIRPILERIFLVHNGGAVINFQTPLVLDTNSAILFTSRSCTSHSVFVQGYTI